ncbi:LuxR C-terminal-related transcriptional regulator [Actinomycetospora termitidis]|uniref:LuxR C-terminal-related transcriptional regulator n=1 Tax=Actinomycetospora termitidis TaxID=3053470 RepID=A0ABT7M693_9PSEU|nr:LuxR C-terminal-related transcriptional regulator [Actinomycetospora sp. Odt1-22]MDL5156187.1 LuxR C-terminal-related transcriptional regulator [Actinomycetospora sp. Odt1-22]
MSRPSLWARLEQGARSSLTTVVGPPGAGKTMLVADWLDRSPAAPARSAWLTLEGADRASDAFWGAVLDALRAVDALPDGSALADLRPAPVVDDAFVDALVEGLAELPAPVVLVLDDVHRLGTTLPTGLDAVLATTDALRVVALGRGALPVARPRLLLAGRLTEIGPTDLAFTAGEIDELFAGTGVALDGAALHAVMQRTHGWAAAVRVAAVRWAEEGDRGLARLGHDGPLADLLAAELLDGLDDERDLLVRCAPVAALTAELAAVLDSGEARPTQAAVERARDRLERLADRHALVARMAPTGSAPGTTWYACHPLLRDLLLTRLAQDPAAFRRAHVLAAGWSEDRDRPIEALEHAITAEDWSLVADVAVRSAAARFVGEERTALLDALARIPRARAQGDVALTTALAALAYCRFDVDDLARQIAAADAALATDAGAPPGSVRRGSALVVLRVVEAALAKLSGDAERMLTAARAAAAEVAALPATEVPGWAVYEDVTEVNVGLAEMWSGAFDTGSRRLATRTVVGAGTATFGLHAAGLRALGLVVGGHPVEAARLAERALERARGLGWDHMPTTAAAWATAALAALERGDLVVAGASVEAVRALSSHLGVDWLVQTAIDLADVGVRLLERDVAAATDALAGVDRRIAGGRSTGILPTWTDYVGAQVELASGRPDAVLARPAVARRRSGRRSDSGATELSLDDRLAGLAARALLMTGEVDEASAVLAAVRPAGDLDPVTRIETDLARAVLWGATDGSEGAARTLADALRRAGDHSVLRPLLLAEPALTAMLDDHVRRGPHAPGASRATVALAARVRRSRPVAPAPVVGNDGDLTTREREVLHYLPSLLTVPQIAGQMHLTAHTVRHHLKGLYRKLEAANRREAVAAAVGRGLITAPTDLERQVRSS